MFGGGTGDGMYQMQARDAGRCGILPMVWERASTHQTEIPEAGQWDRVCNQAVREPEETVDCQEIRLYDRDL